MTNSTAPATRRTLGVTVVVLLPLLWWCLTLVTGALGLWWETIGNVVVTWNIDTAVGLLLLIPAAMFAGTGVPYLRSQATFHRGRRYATAGLFVDCIVLPVGVVQSSTQHSRSACPARPDQLESRVDGRRGVGCRSSLHRLPDSSNRHSHFTVASST